MRPQIVYERGLGVNVFDTDGNRYVDLVGGFGAQLLGHCHPELTVAITQQAARLTQALGDVYPCTTKIELQERLARLLGAPASHRVILGQSGADAITAALKTAQLATGRPGVIAFTGAYHGLCHGPLALCQLREGYRLPFAEQLNPHVSVLPYPHGPEEVPQLLRQLEALLAQEHIGAAVIEPILGRGGCIEAPSEFLQQLVLLCRKHHKISIFDEILTGLGRSGVWITCEHFETQPDIVCVGKGLGGGLPLSACIGSAEVMKHWAKPNEVVHTTTFAGAPLAAAAALQLLTILERNDWVAKTAARGKRWIETLRQACGHASAVREVRGRGFLIGIDVGPQSGNAVRVCQNMLKKGWIASTGGGTREVVVLTPPLVITDELLDAATAALSQSVQEAFA